MIERIEQAAVAIDWIVADTVYGGNFDLRNWLELHQHHYVLAVACTEAVALQIQGGGVRVEAALVEHLLAEQLHWERLSMGQGTNGPRLYDWALLPMLHRGLEDGCHFLLIRRNIAHPSQRRYYLVWAPPQTPLAQIVEAIGCRWHIEEDFENTKDMGLDHYEVRSFIGWYRHITLVLLAYAFAVSICSSEATRACCTLPTSDPASGFQVVALHPLSVPEVRHLLGQIIWPPKRSQSYLLSWSWWRRWHQSLASFYRCRQPLPAG
jgi:SRSO17 transposase